MTPVDKARDVLALPVATASAADAHVAMLAALRRHLVGFLRDPEFCIDQIDARLGSDRVLYIGHGNGVRRLLFELTLDATNRSAGVALVATHGELDAHPDQIEASQRGERTPGAGNRTLVARLLHVAACQLRASGFSEVTNHPVHPGLAHHYATMGFRGGTTLSLERASSLARAFSYIEERYGADTQPGLSISLPPPPL